MSFLIGAGKKKLVVFIFLADGTDSQTLEYAYNFGFKFVDVRVEMELDLRNFQQTETPGLEIKPITEKRELSSIFSFALKSHTDSRFFKDLNFDRIKCEKLYERWIYRDFDKGNILGFFPNEKEIIKGYITFTLESLDVARIGLIASGRSLSWSRSRHETT